MSFDETQDLNTEFSYIDANFTNTSGGLRFDTRDLTGFISGQVSSQRETQSRFEVF